MKLRTFHVLIVVLMSPYLVQSQSFGEKQVSDLNQELAKLIYSDTESADSLAHVIIRIAQREVLKEEEARSHRYLALMYLLNGKLEEAKFSYVQNLDLALESKDNLWIGKAYYYLSEVTQRQGDDVLTLGYLFKALSFIEDTKDINTLAKIHSSLGTHYRKTGDIEKTEMYYNHALNIRKDQKDSMGLFNSYVLFGTLYSSVKLYDKAKQNYIESLNFINSDVRSPNLGAVYSNLGAVYFQEQNLDSAMLFYDLAVKEYEKSGDVYSKIAVHNNIAALRNEQGDYKGAITTTLAVIGLAKEIDAKKLLSSLYYNLSDNYKALKDFEKSFYYYKLSDSIDYELTNKEKNAQLAELQVQYETEKKDKEIALQNIALVKGSAQRNLLIAGISGLVIISLIIYRALARKKRSNRLLTEQKYLVEKREKEKALLLRELHHRVKNNFQIVSSLLNLQYYDTEDLKAAQAIKSGQARVEAMSMIHRELYQSENITSIEMGDYVKHMIENTAYSFQYESEQIDVLVEVDNKPLSVKYAIPLGIIVNELVTNSFKHAFETVSRPMLSVTIKIDEEKGMISLIVFDNGPGIPDPAHISKSSFGMELIRDLVKQLKGTLSIDSQAGSKFTIDFPIIQVETDVES
tara:strand:- start:3421 stop:5319 length:1899 start_codon:yes stop_codon:yes gene_type:complete